MITRRAALPVLFVVTVAWLVVQILLLPPIAVAEHWRQAETASMAFNLAYSEFNPLLPRINWGGDGPGYVEAELPLYQMLVAALMLIFGDAPWCGAAVSLMCISACAAVVFVLTERRFGPAAGLVAAAYVLGSRLGVHLSTAVMPDALAVLLYVIAFERFEDWLERRTSGPLMTSAVALAMSACIKPTALGLGIAEFGIVLLVARTELRRPRLWLAWGLTLALTVAYLAHAASLHAAYGNSFGVLSGGDSKFPRLVHVFDRNHLYSLARVSLEWGIGIVPLVLGLVMLARRRWEATEWSLAIANLIVLLVSMRYATLDYAGGHYHMFAMIFAAWLVAKAFAMAEVDLRRLPLARRALVAVTIIALAAQYVRGISRRRQEDHDQVPSPIVELGHVLATRVGPRTLVVAQSDDDAWDAEWQRVDNYQDPRLFYASGTRGWVLAHDGARPELLAEYAARGAEFYVVAGDPPPTLAAWLADHARVVYRDRFGTIYELTAGEPTD